MNQFFAETDSWIIAVVLGVCMVAAWFAGYWRGQRLPPDERPRVDATFSGASMALLGLLLGFTFSMSLSKHEQRRQMVVTDGNAMADYYTCVSLVKEPARSELQRVVREYAKQRLEAAKSATPPSDEALANYEKTHGRMQELTNKALEAGTSIAVPLTNTLNALTSSHQTRVAAGFDRVPPSIILLLAFAAIVTMALVGLQRGAAGDHRHSGAIGFVLLASLVVWVILDLNQPRKGMITVSQDPMERIVRGMQ